MSPLVAVSRGQLAGQLSWATTPPRLSDLPTLSWSLWFANRQLGLLVWVMVGVGVIAATRARPGPRVLLLTVGLGIGLLPALALLLASEVRRAFAARYVASGAVFLCLLAGYGLTRARGRWMIVVSLVAAVGVVGFALPHWHSDRTRAGHGEDVSAIADVLSGTTVPSAMASCGSRPYSEPTPRLTRPRSQVWSTWASTAHRTPRAP